MGNRDFMSRYSAFSPYRMVWKELGFPTPIGTSDAIAKSLYCGMKPIASWDAEQANALPTGGVFNLEFSPEGSLLVAACEKKSIQLFDPLMHRRIHTVQGAHSDCVNCVKFLDGRMFATCSDDTTIALWDVRNLKKKIRSLLGHSNWVKNIEFSVKDKLLVTSGLDGSIYTWDINSYTENNLVYQRVFNASGLMRCRLSPDARQMVMCTTGGLLVIVHDLNLFTLAQTLHGFKPNLFRLMQMSQQLIPVAAMYDHLFDRTRKENRIEFISDFPEGNDAEVVSALQIHPQGWSALSRNISHDDRSEWTCIHDIQPDDIESEKSCRDTAPTTSAPAPAGALAIRRLARRMRLRVQRSRRFNPVAAPPSSPRPHPRPAPRASSAQPSSSSAEASSDSSTGSPRLAGGIQNDVWEASISIKQHRMIQDLSNRGQVGRNFNMQRIMGIQTGISPPAAGAAPRSRPTPRASPRASSPPPPLTLRDPLAPGRYMPETPHNSVLPSTSGQAHSDGLPPNYIRQNKERLLYYVEETNEGKGFIKELCYSADGRLVCSPFGRGMRLLALNQHCSELSTCIQDFKAPSLLTEIGQSLGVHQDLVVSSKFSPRYHILVTGCLDGKVVWYEPYSGETLY